MLNVMERIAVMRRYSASANEGADISASE